MASVLKLESFGQSDVKEILTVESGVVTVGREADNSLVVNSTSVSRQHARIIEAGTQWVFQDLGSTNGSWINGVELRPNEIKLLRSGDILQLADFPMRVARIGGDIVKSGSLSMLDTAVAPSVLIFDNQEFKRESLLQNTGSRFLIGAEDGELSIDVEPDNALFEIVNNGKSLEIRIKTDAEAVELNGLIIVDTAVLSDRDKIVIGNYQIIVNDFRSAFDLVERAIGSSVNGTKHHHKSGDGGYFLEKRPESASQINAKHLKTKEEAVDLVDRIKGFIGILTFLLIAGAVIFVLVMLLK